MDFNLASEGAIPDIDFEAELNTEQLAAVRADPGPVLVLAGAGSGKTRTLTFRVAWLLKQGVPARDILLLTFTNKAAKEMLHRVEDLTGIPGHKFWGGTFHHIGHKILRANASVVGLDRGFTILDADESEKVLRDVVEEKHKGFFKDKTHPKAGVIFTMLSLARNTCSSLSSTVTRLFPQHEYLLDQLEPFAAAYKAKKLTLQVVDYDDLLEFWLEILQKAPHAAEYYQQRFKHTLVDEYQDTNALQSRIVDLMGANHQIMAVGDDAQCIYSWRGADVDNILTFPDRHEGTVIHRIETNYRSTPEILNLANGVLLNQPRGRGFEKELRPARPANMKPFVVPSMDTNEQAAFVIRRLQGLQSEGVRLKDVAVLYRAHFQALDLQLELTRQGVPFQITSGLRFFEQAHVRDVTAMLRFVYNPKDAPAFNRFCVLLQKVGDKGAQKILETATACAGQRNVDLMEALLMPDVTAKVAKDSRDEWPKLVHSLRDMADAMKHRRPHDVVEVAIEGWYGDYLKGAYTDYSNRLDDLRSMIGFAARFEDMQELLAQVVLLTSETGERHVDPDEDAVRLTTVHQAKGLEYQVVFLIGLADGLFPLRRAIEEDGLEEERRLFYVAVTRARDELYLLYPRVTARGGPAMLLTPSRFIEELDPELYEKMRTRRTERSWSW